MRNTFLDNRSALDIEGAIDRLHKEMGLNSGHVHLDIVRDRLKIDKKYYTTNDPSLLQEAVHKLRLGVAQVFQRPTLLAEAIQKFDLQALYLPDRKRILIDENLPDLKKRWNEAHEIAHSLIPWHADYMHGDNSQTLSPACHEQIEAEANYGAGRLLFPHNQFVEVANASPASLAHVRAIAAHFGNTITSTLWRVVENSPNLMFGLIGEHPRYPRVGEAEIAYLIRSRDFDRMFPHVNEVDLSANLKTFCKYNKTGPLGSGELVLSNAEGERYVFVVESFSNGHQTLTLGSLYVNTMSYAA